jgi:hypothetical protein
LALMVIETPWAAARLVCPATGEMSVSAPGASTPAPCQHVGQRQRRQPRERRHVRLDELQLALGQRVRRRSRAPQSRRCSPACPRQCAAWPASPRSRQDWLTGAARRRNLHIGPVLRGQFACHHQFDEIIVTTLPRHVSRWLRADLPHQAERRFRLPVTTIITSY